MRCSAGGVAAWALLLAASNLSAQTAARPTPSTVAGCYALTLGPWQRQYPGGAAEWQNIPGVIRLDTAFNAQVAGWHTLGPTPSHFTRWGRGIGPAWRVRSTDSIEAFWSTGFVGTALMLGVRGDTLIGTATASTDVRGREPDPTASARAVRVACPAELR